MPAWIPRRRDREPVEGPASVPAAETARSAGEGPVLIHALDGFLGAGSASRIAADHLGVHDGDPVGEVVEEFDLDDYYDYRARRPPMVFDIDHYRGYEAPRLDVRRLVDEAGTDYLLLSGPEPDFRWGEFARRVDDVIERLDVSLTVGLGAVPMGVPHTRPLVLTHHATRTGLVDGRNLFSGQLMVPASAQSVLEQRLGEQGRDALGYVVHVPQYLAQVDYPTASIALLEAVARRTGLVLDLEPLRSRQVGSIVDIEKQIREQDGGEVLAGLERQYDAFTRGAGSTLLAGDEPLPSGDDLGREFEQFLAQMDTDED